MLFEATCEERWLTEARSSPSRLIARFADPERGGFFSTAADGEALIARRKDLDDSPIPSGASSAALGLLRLAQLTGEDAYERHALGVLALLHEIAPRHPTSFGHLLQALHWHLAPAAALACAVPGPAPRSGGRAPRARHPASHRRENAHPLELTGAAQAPLPTTPTRIDRYRSSSHWETCTR